MTNQTTNKSPFLILQRNKIVEELLQKPDCFALLTQIALRAKRANDFNLQNLQIGESFIGDYQRAGLTEQRYRTAKNNLSKWGFATFKSTNKGTIAKLIDSRIYNLNLDEINEQTNERATNKLTNEQRTTNEQLTTNNNIINKEEEELKEIKEKEKLLVASQFENFWQAYIPVRTKDGFIQKGSKQKAEIAFNKAIKKNSFEKIMQALESYLRYCSENQRFTKHVASWLNDANFEEIESTTIIAEKVQQTSKNNGFNNLMEKYENQ